MQITVLYLKKDQSPLIGEIEQFHFMLKADLLTLTLTFLCMYNREDMQLANYVTPKNYILSASGLYFHI